MMMTPLFCGNEKLLQRLKTLGTLLHLLKIFAWSRDSVISRYHRTEVSEEGPREWGKKTEPPARLGDSAGRIRLQRGRIRPADPPRVALPCGTLSSNPKVPRSQLLAFGKTRRCAFGIFRKGRRNLFFVSYRKYCILAQMPKGILR